MSYIPSEYELYFRGERQYVHAALQLKYALWEIKQDLSADSLMQIYVQRYKQLREAKSPLRLMRSDKIEQDDRVKSRMTIIIAGRHFDYSLASCSGTLNRITKPFRQYGFTEIDKETASACLDNPLDFWESLEESIQLTKVFHQQTYNREFSYRFVVGGFEQLRFQKVGPSQTLTMICRIHHHFIRRDTIYNQVKITVEDSVHPYDFIMTFIGIRQEHED